MSQVGSGSGQLGGEARRAAVALLRRIRGDPEPFQDEVANVDAEIPQGEGEVTFSPD